MMRLRLAIELARRGGNFPGRWRVLRWIAGRPRELMLLPPRRMRVADDVELLVEAFNNRDMYIQPAGRDKDELVLQVFEALLRPGDNLLDIGANIGRMSVMASRRVGAAGKVVAFEPSPVVVASLYRNIFFNQCDNVSVRGHAVSDADGSLTFHVPLDTNSGLGSFRDLGKGESLAIDVPISRIDAITELPATVRLIKIDTEGADLRVVRGAQALVARCRPVIVMEFSPRWIEQLGDSPAWIFEFAQAHGYSLYQLTAAGPRPVSEVPAKQIDLLCTPVALKSADWKALADL